MPLITGKDCSLTVGGKDFDDVVNLFALAFETEKLEYQTLAGPRAAGGSESGTLAITFAYDSGESDSLFDALWLAAGDPITYSAAVGASTFSGTAIAVRPGANATAGEVSEVEVELTLDGIPTKAPTVAAP